MNSISHNDAAAERKVKVSVVLLDWSCREWFQSLQYLAQQDVARESYELIWVELFDRIPEEAKRQADAVITCGQRGLYHKHKGYNEGLLQAQGDLVTVCDSDAVFPPTFISSILNSFNRNPSGSYDSKVLMHHEYRTKTVYPGHLAEFSDVHRYEWAELWPNVGACMTVRRKDAIRFGGFDEHPSFRGYLCGPFDLGWRLVNAGIPEEWHDPATALYHFAHPDPVASFEQKFSMRLWAEKSHPHIDHHPLTAVQAFSAGRLLPIKENPRVHRLRMASRTIGTEFERRYAEMWHLANPSLWQRATLRAKFFAEPLASTLMPPLLKIFRAVAGESVYQGVRRRWLAWKDANALHNQAQATKSVS